ncbi:MAG: ABC transporter permease [Candidatus Competibacter sp.]|nr:ABC transporter permease [Candidatus Competibacter sp.]MDG4604554.1 ABC transporter permease [Candidatus Contendobacter sp.]HRD48218.1 ABC transporter permease [Candidatus Contendobacter sp.]
MPIRYLPGALRLLPPFIGRELREQYAGSLLGVLWSVLQPILYILLYWWVFAAVMRTRFAEGSALADTPFIVFLLSALLPWFAFQEGLNRAAGAILNRREMVRKVHFPVIVFPLAAAAAAFMVQAGSYVLFLAVWALWRGGFSLNALGAVAVLLGLQFAVTAGLGLLLAAFTVYLRDITQALGLLLAVIFYTAPILYPLTLAPAEFHSLIRCNPFTAFAEGYHSAVLVGVWPESLLLAGLILFAVGALAAGAYVFQRLEPGFADVL